MPFIFTLREIKEIAIASVVLSIAFALAYADGILNAVAGLGQVPVLVGFAFIAVGIGFLAHELIGHKLVAQRLGMHAEFKMWPFGLLIALVSSLAGFVFAAPGAVYVQSRVDLWGRQIDSTKKAMGIVSLMGPIINIIIAAAFLALQFTTPLIVQGVSLFALGVFVNVWLALFNMLPIPPLDGSKVLAWDRRIWGGVFAVCVASFIALMFV